MATLKKLKTRPLSTNLVRAQQGYEGLGSFLPFGKMQDSKKNRGDSRARSSPAVALIKIKNEHQELNKNQGLRILKASKKNLKIVLLFFKEVMTAYNPCKTSHQEVIMGAVSKS